MKKNILCLLFIALAMAYSSQLLAQDFIIFPAKGQSQEQLEKDKFECYNWAKGQTGFDPMAPQQTAQTPQPADKGPGGERVRGAARGAVIGAVVGEIADDDASKGAKAGAAAGAISGGMRKRQRARQQAQAQQQQQAQQTAAHEEERNKYNRAYTACLEGKGYTVK